MKKLVAQAVKLGRVTFVEAKCLDLVPRWLEWRRLTVEILWDETGNGPKGPEVLKLRACPVV